MACNETETAPVFDCVTQLKLLLDAYSKLSMGSKHVKVEHSDGGRVASMEFFKPDLPRIASMYNQLYASCGASLGAGYPSKLIITPETYSVTARGNPSRARFR